MFVSSDMLDLLYTVCSCDLGRIMLMMIAILIKAKSVFVHLYSSMSSSGNHKVFSIATVGRASTGHSTVIVLYKIT